MSDERTREVEPLIEQQQGSTKKKRTVRFLLFIRTITTCATTPWRGVPLEYTALVYDRVKERVVCERHFNGSSPMPPLPPPHVWRGEVKREAKKRGGREEGGVEGKLETAAISSMDKENPKEEETFEWDEHGAARAHSSGLYQERCCYDASLSSSLFSSLSLKKKERPATTTTNNSNDNKEGYAEPLSHDSLPHSDPSQSRLAWFLKTVLKGVLENEEDDDAEEEEEEEEEEGDEKEEEDLEEEEKEGEEKEKEKKQKEEEKKKIVNTKTKTEKKKKKKKGKKNAHYVVVATDVSLELYFLKKWNPEALTYIDFSTRIEMRHLHQWFLLMRPDMPRPRRSVYRNRSTVEVFDDLIAFQSYVTSLRWLRVFLTQHPTSLFKQGTMIHTHTTNNPNNHNNSGHTKEERGFGQWSRPSVFPSALSSPSLSIKPFYSLYSSSFFSSPPTQPGFEKACDAGGGGVRYNNNNTTIPQIVAWCELHLSPTEPNQLIGVKLTCPLPIASQCERSIELQKEILYVPVKERDGGAVQKKKDSEEEEEESKKQKKEAKEKGEDAGTKKGTDACTEFVTRLRITRILVVSLDTDCHETTVWGMRSVRAAFPTLVHLFHHLQMTTPTTFIQWYWPGVARNSLSSSPSHSSSSSSSSSFSFSSSISSFTNDTARKKCYSDIHDDIATFHHYQNLLGSQSTV